MEEKFLDDSFLGREFLLLCDKVTPWVVEVEGRFLVCIANEEYFRVKFEPAVAAALSAGLSPDNLVGMYNFKFVRDMFFNSPRELDVMIAEKLAFLWKAWLSCKYPEIETTIIVDPDEPNWGVVLYFRFAKKAST